MGWHYAALEERFQRIAGIEGALAILDWDTAVIMPKKAAGGRGEQLATLKRLAHDLLTHPETGEQLAEAEAEGGLDAWQQANLREMHWRYRHAHSIEPALVEALARATTACEITWRDARANADFASLVPQLEEVVRLTREAAQVKGAALGLDPYDAMLDTYQPDLRDAQLVPLFDRLAQDLLFFCAMGAPARESDAPVLTAVRRAWNLGRFSPVDYMTPQFGRFDPVLLAQARPPRRRRVCPPRCAPNSKPNWPRRPRHRISSLSSRRSASRSSPRTASSSRSS